MPLSQGNIGHRDVTFYNANSNLNRFEEGTENPRVGGSIPPLAISIKYLRDLVNLCVAPTATKCLYKLAAAKIPRQLHPVASTSSRTK